MPTFGLRGKWFVFVISFWLALKAYDAVMLRKRNISDAFRIG